MKIKLKENGMIVTINENDYNELDLNNLNTTDIKDKNELIKYLNNAKKEYYSRTFIQQRIKDINIFNVENTKNRFDMYDAVAISANTLVLNEYQIYMHELNGNYSIYNFNGELNEDVYEEPIYLEYKYRYDLYSDKYSSVVIDHIKYNELKQLHEKTNKRIFIFYLFKDKKIRMLELFKQNIDYIMYNKRIKDNVYNNRMKVVDLYCFNNDKTILI